MTFGRSAGTAGHTWRRAGQQVQTAGHTMLHLSLSVVTLSVDWPSLLRHSATERQAVFQILCKYLIRSALAGEGRGGKIFFATGVRSRCQRSWRYYNFQSPSFDLIGNWRFDKVFYKVKEEHPMGRQRPSVRPSTCLRPSIKDCSVCRIVRKFL